MKHAKQETGVIIENGASDWQIYQQDAKGAADLRLSGRWLTATAHRQAQVLVRVVREDEYGEVNLALNWQKAKTAADGTWSHTVRRVPAGGLYRLETVLQLDGGPVEWAQRGDMAHHLGVGDIWVITGQSNSSGYGKTPVLDPPELGVHMFHASGEWRLASHPLSDSTGSQYPANRETANGSHAPWLHFARLLKRDLGYPIGLIPAALGGSPLSAWARSGGGHLFENLLGYLRDAEVSRAAGVVWYQGESDTAEATRAIYAERFRELLGDLRRALHNRQLPMITVQLNRYIGEAFSAPVHANWEAMREIQRQLAREEKGVYLLSTLDLGLSDGIHNDSHANLAIGARAAAIALGAVHGRGVKCLHPDLESVLRPTPTQLDLVFANVDTRLHYECRIPEQLPFAVRDAEGDVPIAGWSLPAANVVRLELARVPGDGATVIGAPTAYPPTVVPFDICGYRPMLAFTAPIPPG